MHTDITGLMLTPCENLKSYHKLCSVHVNETYTPPNTFIPYSYLLVLALPPTALP